MGEIQDGQESSCARKRRSVTGRRRRERSWGNLKEERKLTIQTRRFLLMNESSKPNDEIDDK
jgi:hypothetical protein